MICQPIPFTTIKNEPLVELNCYCINLSGNEKGVSFPVSRFLGNTIVLSNCTIV